MDILIKNAKIIDGTGSAAYEGNIGITEGKLFLQNLPDTADVVIDAAGKCVTPGFVDSHSHGDAVLGLTFGDLCKINQGVTTQIAAQCGGSMAPVTAENLAGIQGFMNAFRMGFPEEMAEWTEWGKYADYVDTLPKIANVKLFVGFNTVRIAVMGYDDRKPTAEELETMKAMVRNAMENGALGLSSGLAYVPATFDDVETIIELAKEIAPYNGIYVSHIRNESFDLVRAVEEAIEVGRQAKVPVNISHFKAMGRSNWGTPKNAIAVIDKARAEGITVTVDQYPYNCSMTHYSPCMPPWYFKDGMDKAVEMLKDPEMRKKIQQEMDDPATDYENLYLNAGGWDGITICACEKVPEAEGMTVTEYAASVGKAPFDAYFDLMIANNGAGTAVYHSIGDDDIYDIIRLPYAVVGSDGIVRSRTEKCHPRGWGTMTRAICGFTKDKQILPLEEMIYKITGLPAEIFSLKNKGVIREGYDADLVVFDYDALADNATYTEPTNLAGGIEYVIVNGKIVCHNNELTGETPGQLLRHN